MHFCYIDASGDNVIGILTAVIIPAEQWHRSLGMLKEFRHRLHRQFGVYIHKEFHALELVSGRGRISDRVVGKWQRCEIFRGFLKTVASLPGVRIMNAIYAKKQDERALERLLNRINRLMEASGSLALLILDRGKEHPYTKLVRRMRVYNPIPSMHGGWGTSQQMLKNVPLQRIVEDPFFKESHQSYFIQAADCAAYALLRRERPLPSKKKYCLHRAFDLLAEGEVLVREASRRDPEGIIRL